MTWAHPTPTNNESGMNLFFGLMPLFTHYFDVILHQWHQHIRFISTYPASSRHQYAACHYAACSSCAHWAHMQPHPSAIKTWKLLWKKSTTSFRCGKDTWQTENASSNGSNATWTASHPELLHSRRYWLWAKLTKDSTPTQRSNISRSSTKKVTGKGWIPSLRWAH